jgi:hypothetical protein
MRLMAAFVPHRQNKYFHVIVSNGIVSIPPYTPHAIMTASPIASRQVFETVRHADVVSLRSVRSQDAIDSSIIGTPTPPAAVPYRTSGLVQWRKAVGRQDNEVSCATSWHLGSSTDVHTGRRKRFLRPQASDRHSLVPCPAERWSVLQAWAYGEHVARICRKHRQISMSI